MESRGKGLLLILDELGKFLEFTALHHNDRTSFSCNDWGQTRRVGSSLTGNLPNMERLAMELKGTVKVFTSEQKTITRSELTRLTFCNSGKLPLAMNDGGVRKEWLGIGWIEGGKPHGDEVRVIDDPPKLAGRFGIVLPKSNQVILFGRRRLWGKRQEASSTCTTRAATLSQKANCTRPTSAESAKTFGRMNESPKPHAAISARTRSAWATYWA